MAPRVGIEPTTNGLTVRCSTAELPGNRWTLEGRGFSDKRVGGVKAARHIGRSGAAPGLKDTARLGQSPPEVRDRRSGCRVHSQPVYRLIDRIQSECQASTRGRSRRGALEIWISLQLGLARHF